MRFSVLIFSYRPLLVSRPVHEDAAGDTMMRRPGTRQRLLIYRTDDDVLSCYHSEHVGYGDCFDLSNADG